MSINVFRKVVIALLVSIALTGAGPAQAARRHPHRNDEDPARNQAPQGPVASLLYYFFELFECAGGAMDPNGSH